MAKPCCCARTPRMSRIEGSSSMTRTVASAPARVATDPNGLSSDSVKAGIYAPAAPRGGCFWVTSGPYHPFDALSGRVTRTLPLFTGSQPLRERSWRRVSSDVEGERHDERVAAHALVVHP